MINRYSNLPVDGNNASNGNNTNKFPQNLEEECQLFVQENNDQIADEEMLRFLIDSEFFYSSLIDPHFLERRQPNIRWNFRTL